MGSHVWQCDQCGVRAELFNSCNNRHCPKCQTQNRKDWAARLQADLLPKGDVDAAAKTIDYLSRYANRVAISNSRLLGIDGEEVLFRYKDYQDGDQWKTMRLPGVEFIRRFLLHILPKGMRHIRRFGFMGPSVHTQNLNRIRELLGVHERKAATRITARE